MHIQHNHSIAVCIALCILILIVSCRVTQEQQVVYVAATPRIVAFDFFQKSTLIPTTTPTDQPTLIATSTPTTTPTQTSTTTPTTTSSNTPTTTHTPTPSPTSSSTPTSTAAPTDTASPTRSPVPPPVYSRGDLHIHTRCSDGTNGYEVIVNKALRLAYDFIAITDHRFGGLGPCGHADGTCDDKTCDRIIAKCRKETRLLCFPGMEITSTSQHLLAIGIQTGIDESLPMQAQVGDIHQQAGLAILAHPGLLGTQASQLPDFSMVDGIECRSTYFTELIPSFFELSQMFGVPCVYNSDAHSTDNMGIHTVCLAQVRSIQDLKIALMEGKCMDGTL